MRAWVVGIAACLLAATLGNSQALADGGTISFSGGVYAPTCSNAGDARDHASEGSRIRCEGAAGAVSGNASAYGLRVTPLTGSVDDGNPLLDYFVGNLAPDQRTQAQLVTRTYE